METIEKLTSQLSENGKNTKEKESKSKNEQHQNVNFFQTYFIFHIFKKFLLKKIDKIKNFLFSFMKQLQNNHYFEEIEIIKKIDFDKENTLLNIFELIDTEKLLEELKLFLSAQEVFLKFY